MAIAIECELYNCAGKLESKGVRRVALAQEGHCRPGEVFLIFNLKAVG